MLLTENNDGCYSSPPNVWIRLSGPAADLLQGALFGPKVEVFQEIWGKEEVAAQSEDTENSGQKEEECFTSCNALPGGSCSAECVQETGKGTIEIVNPATVPPTKIVMGGSIGPRKFLKVLKTNRIVLLGETKVGKSSLGNTILGEDVFKISQTKHDRLRECQAESKSVHGRRITVIDTPGFYGTDKPEAELNSDVARCIAECATGPHVFLIVLKVEEFPEQQRGVIDQIRQCLSEEALKYAAVVFTHGDQLPEGKKIEDVVAQSKCLSGLMKKCSGRYHVVNNNNNCERNRLKVAELLNTVDKIIKENRGGFYINKKPPAEKKDEKQEGNRTSVGNVPQGGASNDADSGAWVKLTGPAAGSVAEALFGRAGEAEEPDDRYKDAIEKETEEEEETATVPEDDKEVETETENEEMKEKTNEETDQKTPNKTKTDHGGTGECDRRKPLGGGGGSGNVLGFLFGLIGAAMAGTAAVILGPGLAAATAAVTAAAAAFTAAFTAATTAATAAVTAAAAAFTAAFTAATTAATAAATAFAGGAIGAAVTTVGLFAAIAGGVFLLWKKFLPRVKIILLVAVFSLMLLVLLSMKAPLVGYLALLVLFLVSLLLLKML